MSRTREQLLDAASDYLRLTGFQDTSMEDIAGGIGVPRTALYYHFGGKGNLLAEILLGGSEQALAIVAEIAAYPISTVDRLTLVIRSLLSHNLRNPAANLASVHHVDSPLLSAEQRASLVEKRNAIDRAVRGLLEDAIAEGSIRGVNVPVVSNAILTSIGRVQSWYRSEGPLDIDEIAAIYADLYLKGLATDNPPGPFADVRSGTRRPKARSK